MTPQKRQTLKQQVHLLIHQHGLHELLERLADVVNEEAEIHKAKDLEQVVVHLDSALDQALRSRDHSWS